METKPEIARFETYKYKLRDNFSLKESLFLKDSILPDPGFEALERHACRAGFVEDSYALKTKRGAWNLYKRLNHEVPNFPGGPTVLHSWLALYSETAKDYTSAVLWQSEAPNEIEMPELTRDLNTLTSYCIERSIWRSFLIGEDPMLLLVYAVVGMAVGLSLDAIQNGISDMQNALNGTLGGAGLAVASVVYGSRMDKRTGAKIPWLNEYVAGNNIWRRFNDEADHTMRARAQEAVYSALVPKYPSLDPELFLSEVYSQIPPRLLEDFNRDKEGKARDRLIKFSEIFLDP